MKIFAELGKGASVRRTEAPDRPMGDLFIINEGHHAIYLDTFEMNALINFVQEGLCPSCHQPLDNIHDMICDECLDNAVKNRDDLFSKVVDRWLDVRRQGYGPIDAITDVLEEHSYMVVDLREEG